MQYSSYFFQILRGVHTNRLKAGDRQRLMAKTRSAGAVLVPTYDDSADAEALETIGACFPGREAIGIDCRPLIVLHGSLHCVTMQLPAGVVV